MSMNADASLSAAKSTTKSEQSPLRRQQSARSSAALDKLSSLEVQLSGLEEQFKTLVVKASEGPEMNLVLQIKDQLALMNGQVDKLQMHGVDSVLVEDLVSAQKEAREKRRELTKRANQLSERIKMLHTAIENRVEELNAEENNQ